MTQKKIKELIYLGMILLIISIVTSTPVPFGIDGVVYGLNGERANSSVNISVYDLNTSFFVQGKLRDDGSYSASIYGEMGDTIVVTVWNNYNTITRLFVIETSMHGYNLSLNLSEPQPQLPQEEENNNHKLRKKIMRRPRVVIGLITMDDEPAGKGIGYEITNLDTGEKVSGEIQDKFNAFAEVIEGEEGDLIELNVGDANYNERNVFPITGQVVRNDIDMNITKLEFNLIKFRNSFGPYVLGTLLFIIIAIVLGKTNKKR